MAVDGTNQPAGSGADVDAAGMGGDVDLAGVADDDGAARGDDAAVALAVVDVVSADLLRMSADTAASTRTRPLMVMTRTAPAWPLISTRPDDVPMTTSVPTGHDTTIESLAERPPMLIQPSAS